MSLPLKVLCSGTKSWVGQVLLFSRTSVSLPGHLWEQFLEFSTRVWTCNFFNFFAFGYCFMIVFWLEIHDVFFWYFLLFDSVTSGVIANNVDVFKKTRDNTWISFPHHINQFQTSSFLFSLKFELMLLLAILNRLKSLGGIFSCLLVTEFTGGWSCCNMLT